MENNQQPNTTPIPASSTPPSPQPVQPVIDPVQQMVDRQSSTPQSANSTPLPPAQPISDTVVKPVTPQATGTITTPAVNEAANPYRDQQVLPGQTIGYGLPTDQKVFSQPPPNAIVKKSHKTLIILGTVLLVALVAVAGLFVTMM